MKKLAGLFICFAIMGLMSCSSPAKPAPATVDSTATEKVQQPAASSVNNAEALFAAQVPLLKFPLELSVDSFKNKKNIPVAFDESTPWFSPSVKLQHGTKAAAIGKFYPDMNTAAVVFLISTSSGEEQLMLSVFTIETGAADSRIVATGGTDAYSSTRMKKSDKGIGFSYRKSGQISVIFSSFKITEGKFSEGKPETKTFTADQKGRDESSLLIKSRMK